MDQSTKEVSTAGELALSTVPLAAIAGGDQMNRIVEAASFLAAVLERLPGIVSVTAGIRMLFPQHLHVFYDILDFLFGQASIP